MPEIKPVTKDQLFEKKIAENTGSDYNVGDISDVVPVTKDQALLKEIALNSAGQSGDITELEAKVSATQDMISDAYDSTHTYNVGDYCIYENALYKCNTASTTGTWDSSKWNVVTIANEFTIVKDELKTIDEYGYGDTITFGDRDLIVYGFASGNKFIRIFVPVNIKKNIPQNHIHITSYPTSFVVHCSNGAINLSNVSPIALYRSASGVSIEITFDANNSVNDLPVTFLLQNFELSIYN